MPRTPQAVLLLAVPLTAGLLAASLCSGSARAQAPGNERGAEIVGLSPEKAASFAATVREHCGGKY